MAFRRWFFLGLALAAAVPAVGSARTILAATPISRTDLPCSRARHDAKLHELAQPNPELIFLGDSITADWERTGPQKWQDFAPIWQRMYGDRRAGKLGFQGVPTGRLLCGHRPVQAG